MRPARAFPRTIPCAICGAPAHRETDPVRDPGHYEPVRCECDRRCPICATWLDRYGKCPQCVGYEEPAR